ncbi:hypothetical protein [Acidiplasma cupricumulans]|uniref:Uncharacterized protein n=2 Tax=Acidiplasma cupricumulans TaxID=312540 RepID=A0A0Q0RVY1_9ARCH|nr:hypothetical protein [Acidiplasma cupricumulans]KQB34064.1 hypothetical protein AOG55_01540 [Acidiplasma cupricumulans]
MERNDDVKTNFLENLKQLIDFKKINVIDVIKKIPAKRYEYFNKLNNNNLNKLNLDYGDKLTLSRDGLIYEIGNDKYVVTLKALILARYGVTNIDEFLNDLNKQFFIELYNKNTQELTWDEKTIILTLLGLMACDKNSAFKFTTDENAEVFQKCAKDALIFLQENNVIDSKFTIDDLFNYNARGEHKVQAKMTRINNIRIKTNNIYCKDTKLGHYLKIIIDNNINKDNLYFILRLIFNELPNKQNLINLLNKMYTRRYEVLSEDSNISLSLKHNLEHDILMWTIN